MSNSEERASPSAVSLPGMPTWAGTHSKINLSEEERSEAIFRAK